MAVKIKRGVRLVGIGPEISIGLLGVASVYAEMGVDCWITSGVEGTHMRASEHYQGNALDFRIWVLPESKWKELERRCKENLGDDYNVILESDHLHVSWKPKLPVAP